MTNEFVKSPQVFDRSRVCLFRNLFAVFVLFQYNFRNLKIQAKTEKPFMVSHLVLLTEGSLFQVLINLIYFPDRSLYKQNTLTKMEACNSRNSTISQLEMLMIKHYALEKVCCKSNSLLRHLSVPERVEKRMTEMKQPKSCCTVLHFTFKLFRTLQQCHFLPIGMFTPFHLDCQMQRKQSIKSSPRPTKIHELGIPHE